MALAHEGNPKEDSISINAGELISPATLTVQFSGGGDGGVTGVPPGAEVPIDDDDGGGCGGCEEEATTIRSVDLCANDSIVDHYIIGSYQESPSSLNGSNLFCSPASAAILTDSSTPFDIVVRSGIGTCPSAGFTIWKTTSGISEEMNTRVFYPGPVRGAPISGMCFCVADNAGVCDFTGYVCLFDHRNDQILFGYYVNANLMTGSMTVLAATPGAVTNVYLEAFISTNSWPTFEEFELTTDSFSTLILSYNDLSGVTPGIIPWTRNNGFIWVGNDQVGTHDARWMDNDVWSSIMGGP